MNESDNNWQNSLAPIMILQTPLTLPFRQNENNELREKVSKKFSQTTEFSNEPVGQSFLGHFFLLKTLLLQ